MNRLPISTTIVASFGFGFVFASLAACSSPEPNPAVDGGALPGNDASVTDGASPQPDSAAPDAPVSVDAAPQTIAEGAVYTWSGSGFGTSVPVGDQAFYGASDGPVEQAAAGANVTTSGFLGPGWFVPGGDPQLVSTARAYSGTKSILNAWAQSNFAFGIGYDFNSGYRSIYSRVAFYLQNNGHTDGQVKFQRFVGPNGGGISDGDFPNVLVNEYPGANGQSTPVAANIQSNGGSILPNVAIATDFWQFNAWAIQELFFVPGTKGAADGSIAWRVTRASDGTVIGQGTSVPRMFWSGSDLAFSRWVIQGYIGNAMQGAGVELNIDRDAYAIANKASAAFPRYILLGDAPTYAACTKFAVEKFISYSDTTITFKINRGPHATLANKYVYVMVGINQPLSTTGKLLY